MHEKEKDFGAAKWNQTAAQAMAWGVGQGGAVGHMSVTIECSWPISHRFELVQKKP